jgi:hypothetical protein
MAGCLSVCSNAAKTLAAATGKPLVGVHHMVCFTLYETCQSLTFEFHVLASSRSNTIPDDTGHHLSFPHPVNLWRTHTTLTGAITEVVPDFGDHT